MSTRDRNATPLCPERIAAATPLVRFKARRLCSRHGFRSSDQPDIEQELWHHLVLRAPDYDASIRPWETFVSFILDKKCASIRRDRFAEMRSPLREQCSLDDANGGSALRHTLECKDPGGPQRQTDMQVDVAWAMARMSKLQREIARALATGTVNSAANELGLPRSAVERHIAEFESMFRDADLEGYL